MLTPSHRDKSGANSGTDAWRPSIRTYLILMNLVLLCLLFPSLNMIFLREAEQFRDAQLQRTLSQMRTSLESRSASFVRSMAMSCAQAVAGYDFTFLKILVEQVVANDPEINYCMIMDVDRRAMIHSDPSQLGMQLDHEMDHRAALILKQEYPPVIIPPEHTRDVYFTQVRYIDGTLSNEKGIYPVMEAVTPIYNGSRLWGLLRCGYLLTAFQMESLDVRQDWSVRMDQFKLYFISMTGLFFAIGISVAAFFTRFLIRSMNDLNEGVRQISAGDLDHEIRPRKWLCVEFVRLSEGFNSMTDRLRASYRQLDEYNRSLEEKVAARTKALKEAQSQMIQQAHEAGMAEMAVGVLHNIGNAVTPAIVDSTLLVQRLRSSPLRNNLQESIDQIETLILGQAEVSHIERQRLASVLKLLPASIREEFDGTILKLEGLCDKHTYIEGVIDLQMRYAKLAGNSEEVDVNALVEDALKILEGPLRKRSISVIKNFGDLLPVRIEQAKLIQVFVNLIKNSYEAMESVPIQRRELNISTSMAPDSPAEVMLAIKDTGVGFAPEEGTQLFRFGYSGKHKGSGFGLHSCANFLIANKGSISARSKGRGQGAEFVVKLAVSETSQSVDVDRCMAGNESSPPD